MSEYEKTGKMVVSAMKADVHPQTASKYIAAAQPPAELQAKHTWRTLPYGTPAEVAAEVKEAIDIAAPGGGYILASDHSLHDGIPIENIWELSCVGSEYGGRFYHKGGRM